MTSSGPCHLFVDGSFDPDSKHGVGGWMLVLDLDDSEAREIVFQCVENTTPARLELQTFLCAVRSYLDQNKMHKNIPSLKVYTDSKTVAGLMARRAKLEETDFISKRSGRQLNNGDLYKEFFLLVDSLDVSVEWLKGHSKVEGRDKKAVFFAVVDKAVRAKLRASLGSA